MRQVYVYMQYFSNWDYLDISFKTGIHPALRNSAEYPLTIEMHNMEEKNVLFQMWETCIVRSIFLR